MSITIKLDGPAIEKVLSCQGEETKLELQNTIVQEFTKKHLKGLINGDLVNEWRLEVKQEIIKDLNREVVQSNGFYDLKISDKAKECLSNHVIHLVNTQLQLYINENVISERLEKYLSEIIQRTYKDSVIKLVNEVLSEEQIKTLIKNQARGLLNEKLTGII